MGQLSDCFIDEVEDLFAKYERIDYLVDFLWEDLLRGFKQVVPEAKCRLISFIDQLENTLSFLNPLLLKEALDEEPFTERDRFYKKMFIQAVQCDIVHLEDFIRIIRKLPV